MWETFKEQTISCRKCGLKNILDSAAFPLFMRNEPKNTDILFIWEAPNRDDTYNSNKQYITVDFTTDPSGSFFYDLFVNELKLNIDEYLFVTNSVLCLPACKNGKYPVSIGQMRNCSTILVEMIATFHPRIVCPLGTKALKATSLIEDHGYGSMSKAVSNVTKWYGRILYPLYHTSPLARNPRNGRPENMQRKDWKNLRRVFESI